MTFGLPHVYPVSVRQTLATRGACGPGRQRLPELPGPALQVQGPKPKEEMQPESSAIEVLRLEKLMGPESKDVSSVEADGGRGLQQWVRGGFRAWESPPEGGGDTLHPAHACSQHGRVYKVGGLSSHAGSGMGADGGWGLREHDEGAADHESWTRLWCSHTDKGNGDCSQTPGLTLEASRGGPGPLQLCALCIPWLAVLELHPF